MAIDYADIGRRIKQRRIEIGYTQEKLAEILGIGASHMSHLESGKTVPSMDVFINLCNALSCSADMLLCREIVSGEQIMKNWLTGLVADCDSREVKILSDILIATKDTLRKNKPTE